MKTQMLIILTLLLALASVPVKSANSAYVKKMKSTLDQMYDAKTVQEYMSVANTFSVIANVETDEWLPLYYHANTYVNLIYIDQNADNDKKEEYLKIARTSVEKLLESHPDEVEVQVLDGWYWISRIGLKPMIYGMIYMGNYNSAIERALKIEPDNPRAIFLHLSNKIGKAEWFGNDISEYCVDVNYLNDYWDEYERKTELHPIWGREGIQSQVAKCSATD